MSHHLLECKKVQKEFGGTIAVEQLDLEVHYQEFVALLGPSGCGKSTSLRIIAGFEDINAGEVIIHNKVFSQKQKTIPPEKRNLGMVFQDFALFPHLTVEKNIAFGIQGSRQAKQQRTDEMLELVGLVKHRHKMPHTISGGQQQRVALARTLAPRPKLVLLDEPFSNLDYKLRVQLRQEVYRILRKEEVSAILVTHDQSEAFSFADRIFMMDCGKIVQVGSPYDIYQNPATPWVASFVGEANFISAQYDDGYVNSIFGKHPSINNCLDRNCKLMVRPEDFRVVSQTQTANGVIEHVEFLGDREMLKVKLHSGDKVLAQVEPHQLWKVNMPVEVSPTRLKIF